jgi:transposase
MFVRKKVSRKNPNTYIQLVDNRREGGRVRQKVVKHIGTAINPDQLEHLLKLAEEVKDCYVKQVSEHEIDNMIKRGLAALQGSRTDILNCYTTKKYVTSIHDIYGSVYKKMGLTDIIQSKSDYADVLKDIVMARIAKPSSKRETCDFMEKSFNIYHSLNKIYRMMDKFDEENTHKMQTTIAEYNKKLLKGKIKMLFYDATTIYFESFTSDDLKNLGYSKDCKFNQPQVILTLLVTEEGLPLGYQLLPGNTYEGHTLMSAIKYWQALYPEQKFVLVADSGMLNEINLEYLEQNSVDYIVCSRIKNLPEAVKEDILQRKEDIKEKNISSLFDLKFKSRRLIISYKLERARKDAKDRERSVNSLLCKLKQSKSPTTLISNYGYKKYITLDKESEVQLNEDKINAAEKWDGLHGLITNLEDMEAKEVYSHYRGLWQVEDAFRINKTDLKIRPIFHWTPERIKAHIAISYMAYCCYKAVEFIVNKKKRVYSHRKIRSFLMECEISIMEEKNTGNQFWIAPRLSDEARYIYKAMEIKPEEQSYKMN